MVSSIVTTCTNACDCMPFFVYKAISLQFGQSMTKHDIAFIQVFGKNRHIVQSDNTLVFSFLKNK